MNAKLIVTSAVFTLALGMAAPASAQDQRQGNKQGQPSQPQRHAQQQPAQQQRPAPQQHAQQPPAQRQQPAPQQHAQQPPAQRQQPAPQQHAQQPPAQRQQPAPQQHAQQPPAQRQQPPQRTAAQQRTEQTTWQNHRAGNWQTDHRTWQQRGGYNGYRVPDARYNVYFGQRNLFRIYGLPFMVFDGYPRFQYNGYWITLLDPWPGNWSNDWYDTDDVYVVYGNDGYYMYDDRYPGIGIAISIST
jgi:hypothetical protein